MSICNICQNNIVNINLICCRAELCVNCLNILTSCPFCRHIFNKEADELNKHALIMHYHAENTDDEANSDSDSDIDSETDNEPDEPPLSLQQEDLNIIRYFFEEIKKLIDDGYLTNLNNYNTIKFKNPEAQANTRGDSAKKALINYLVYKAFRTNNTTLLSSILNSTLFNFVKTTTRTGATTYTDIRADNIYRYFNHMGNCTTIYNIFGTPDIKVFITLNVLNICGFFNSLTLR